MIYTLVKKNDEGNVDAVFSFDTVNSYSESWSGTVSKNTVEYGFPVADHINIENPSFEISGKLSTYSIFNSDAEITWDGEDFKQQGDSEKSSTGHLVARENLRNLFLARSTMTLLETDKNSFQTNKDAKVTELKSGYTYEYNNCVITSLNFSVPENSVGGVIAVQMRVEQLNIAYVQTTQLTDAEKQKRIVPLTKSADNIGKSETSTTTETSANKPSGSSVATKSSDPVKAKMPADLAKDYQDMETAKEAYDNVEGGLMNGTISSTDKIIIKDHGGVVNVKIQHQR